MEEMKRSSYPFYNIEICDKVFYSGRNELYRVTSVSKMNCWPYVIIRESL